MTTDTMDSPEEDWPDPEPALGPLYQMFRMVSGMLLILGMLFALVLFANGGAIAYSDQVTTQGGVFKDASVSGTFISGDLVVELSEPLAQSDDIAKFYLVGPDGQQQASAEPEVGQTSVSFTWVTGMRNSDGYTVKAINSEGETVSELSYKREPIHIWEAWKLL